MGLGWLWCRAATASHTSQNIERTSRSSKPTPIRWFIRAITDAAHIAEKCQRGFKVYENPLIKKMKRKPYFCNIPLGVRLHSRLHQQVICMSQCTSQDSCDVKMFATHCHGTYISLYWLKEWHKKILNAPPSKYCSLVLTAMCISRWQMFKSWELLTKIRFSAYNCPSCAPRTRNTTANPPAKSTPVKFANNLMTLLQFALANKFQCRYIKKQFYKLINMPSAIVSSITTVRCPIRSVLPTGVCFSCTLFSLLNSFFMAEYCEQDNKYSSPETLWWKISLKLRQA